MLTSCSEKKGSTFAIPIEAKIGVSIDKSEVGKFFEKKNSKKSCRIKNSL
jgi:hypothetical protein